MAQYDIQPAPEVGAVSQNMFPQITLGYIKIVRIKYHRN